VNYSHLWRGVLLILSLSALGYLVHLLHLTEILSTTWMDQWVRGRGFNGEVLFLVIGAVLTAIGMPRQVVAFFAGYSFGLTFGLLLAVLSTVLGAALDFWYARLLGRDLIKKIFPRQIQHLDHFTRDAPFLKTLAIRLLPVGNNMLTCLVAGVSGIAAAPFLLGSALGYVPQALIFALAGNGVKVNPELQIGIAVLLFLIFGALATYWHHKLRSSQIEDLSELNVNPFSTASRHD
jgi:uncharacterized membrane protein YdjX (TVP38/TMEM64 family)